MNLGSGCQFVGGSGGIKSLQTGTVNLSGVSSVTATITSVDTTNSEFINQGVSYPASTSTPQNNFIRGELTNATTVTFDRYGTDASSAVTCGYTVLERHAGTIKSIQRGTADSNGGTTKTATISSVDTAKTSVTHLGQKLNSATANNGFMLSRVVLTNATTVTITTGSDNGVAQVTGYQAKEEVA